MLSQFFTYGKIALALIKLANLLIQWAKDGQLLDAGQDRAIAIAAAEVLKETETARQVLAEVSGLTDDQVDKALKGLEP